MATGYSSINDGYGTSDCNGHGTHVASSAAGSTYGIASAATVVPVRVLDCDGSGTDSGVIAGLNWVAQNIRATNTTAIVNMSLGGSYDSALNAAVRSIVSLGVPVVVAAGNDGRDACGASPASEPTAITVAASTVSDEEAVYSNYGSCVDIFGPGSSVLAAGISSDTSTSTKSGTSMAAPHVAGYATVVKGLFPSAGATAVAAAVVGSATPNVLSYVSSNTANKLLFVGLARCDVAALAGVVCSALAAPAPAPAPAAPVPTKVTLITSKTPATATNLAKTARLTVPTGAKVSVKVASSASRYCKVRSNKVYAVRSGTCTMSVTVAAKGKKTVTKTLKIKVKK
jgi:subtilisin family serine protease